MGKLKAKVKMEKKTNEDVQVKILRKFC